MDLFKTFIERCSKNLKFKVFKKRFKNVHGGYKMERPLQNVYKTFLDVTKSNVLYQTFSERSQNVFHWPFLLNVHFIQRVKKFQFLYNMNKSTLLQIDPLLFFSNIQIKNNTI